MSRQFHLQTAANVQPKPARWAWEGRFALGNINLFAGREGLGKTTIAEGLLARATRGELPGDLAGQAVHVIYCTAEDSVEATLVPRFLAAGGDPTRIHFLSISTEENGAAFHSTLTLPGDNAKLTEAIDSVNARILVLDPLVGFMDAAFNSHRDQHVRRILGPLAQISSTRDLATIGLIHMNKGDSQDALARISGSVGFSAAARSVLVLAADPDDPEGERGTQRILAHAKCNLGRKMPSITGKIEPALVSTGAGTKIPTSRFVLLGESQRNAGDLMAPQATTEERSARTDALAFLAEELANGPVHSGELKAAADKAGVSWRALERHKSELGVRARKIGTAWVWELPTPPNNPLGGDGGVGGDGKTAKSANTATDTDKADIELAQATPEEEAAYERALTLIEGAA